MLNLAHMENSLHVQDSQIVRIQRHILKKQVYIVQNVMEKWLLKCLRRVEDIMDVKIIRNVNLFLGRNHLTKNVLNVIHI